MGADLVVNVKKTNLFDFIMKETENFGIGRLKVKYLINVINLIYRIAECSGATEMVNS